MKKREKLTITTLQLFSIICAAVLIIVLYYTLPVWAFILALLIGNVIYQEYVTANKTYNKITPQHQEILDNAYDSLEKRYKHPKKHHNADELIQVAEMFRDSMEGSPAKDSLAYKVTVKAINNYYKTA
jgi:hypothetical protein